MNDILRSVRAMSLFTNEVIVLFSGGKDSVVTLDLCRRFFPTVHMAFMYYVKGLSFQERIIRYYENLYGLKCLRVPHFELSEFLRYGTFRDHDFDVPVVSTRDVYNWIREQTGAYWIAGGERINDSVVRRAMIKHSGTIDVKRGRFFPVADWTKSNIVEYISKNRLKVGEESRQLGFSFRSLEYSQISKVKETYPEDYAKIEEWFPLVGVEIKRGETFGREDKI